MSLSFGWFPLPLPFSLWQMKLFKVLYCSEQYYQETDSWWEVAWETLCPLIFILLHYVLLGVTIFSQKNSSTILPMESPCSDGEITFYFLDNLILVSHLIFDPL